MASESGHRTPRRGCRAFALGLVAIGVWSVSVAASAASRYAITDLGIAGSQTSASGLNNKGQVVGQSIVAGQPSFGAYWDPSISVVITFGTAGVVSSRPTSINDGGTIVGNRENGTALQATIWNGFIPSALPALPGTTKSQAVDINNSGTVVGVSEFGSEPSVQATMWSGGIATALNPLVAGFNSGALAINQLGTIAGFAYDENGIHPAVWAGPTPVALDVLPGNPYSLAYDINDADIVVGTSGVNAAVWHGVIPTALDDLPGALQSAALAINDSGTIVGEGIGAYGNRAAEWRDGVVYDLFDESDALARGWSSLYYGLDINEGGQIVGGGMIDGQNHAFLLTPVPEPEIYSLMLAGLAALGVVARLRQVPQRQRAASAT